MGPSRTVTLLFADIEGSTRLLADLGDAYAELLADYYAVLHDAVHEATGREIGTEGDGYFAIFDSARAALVAAVSAQRALVNRTWPHGVTVPVRMGLHTGEARDGPGGPVGLDVHRAARIAAAAHGGQVLLSEVVRVLVQHHVPAGAALLDLGTHRLKDLEQPEHLYQVCIEGLPQDFPRIRTLEAAPSNLPAFLTTFVGREDVLAEAQAVVRANRLVTFTGPGGTGKTRLALQTAACSVGTYTHGVWFVALASVRSPELVPPRVLTALGVPLSRARDPHDQLLEYLSDRNLLLVLDNFEQVLDAAPIVGDLLRTGHDLHVLVTSRAPLHLSGEREVPIPPLRVPTTADLPPPELQAEYESVHLFVERAQAANPAFALTQDNARAVAQLCARLDGLPLAIELAAARVRLLPPQALLARLDHRLQAVGVGPRDLPERQQTLTATIAWSYDLLREGERHLFACLAVFEDGWKLEHAERVCSDGIDPLEGSSTLLDHSLIQPVEGIESRFRMLETIREFALERLARLPEADVIRQRHADVFLAAAEEAAPHLLGRDQAAWARQLERDHANIRAALTGLLQRGAVPQAARMAAALWRYWQKDRVQEGREWTGRILAAEEDMEPALEAAVREAAGGLAYWAGDMGDARVHYERALELEQGGEAVRVANAQYNLAFPLLFTGEHDATLELLEDGLKGFRQAGDAAGEAKAHWGLGCLAYFSERFDDAERELRTSLAAAIAHDDPFNENWSRHMLGITLIRTGQLSEAKSLLTDALRFFADVRDHAAITLLLEDFAQLAGGAGQPERQARLGAASHALQRISGSELARIAREFEGRTPVDAETFAAAWREGLDMTLDHAVAYALSDES